MQKRKLNVSGYRGVWGETLNEDIVKWYVWAFVDFTKKVTRKTHPTILIGRDGRATGGEIRDIIVKELSKVGVVAVDGDILPTPTVLYSVRSHSCDGGIIITASHNPIEYNGLKFVNNKALFTIEDEVNEIENSYTAYEKGEKQIIEDYTDPEKNIPNFSHEHIDHILLNIDVEAIRARKFKVIADMINASASVMDSYLFEKLGVEFIPLNNIPNGQFAHCPEPIRENLISTMELAKEHKVDIGFVHDPDADRLVVINEKGDVILEEYTIALAIKNVLAKNHGRPVVLNLSTSKMGEDIAKEYGSECFRTKVGEGFVVEGILKHKAIIGGEGNGGVIYPIINTARDSFVGIGLILELLAKTEKNISELLEEIPKYFMKKDKWPIGMDLKDSYEKLKKVFVGAKVDEQDGIRFDFSDDSWVHLRPSNTEPIIRLFGEAKTQERIEELFSEVKKNM